VPRYLVVEDCGELINPAIADGQIRGGVAQGIASVLLERHVYADDGQLLTSSFADYLVPAACDLPPVEVEHLHRPPRHEIPWRGVGEGGFLGTPAAVLNAVADALAPLGVAITETHLPPARIRELVLAAGRA
jgi:carbon-monoxide dehydrogenase large subunit